MMENDMDIYIITRTQYSPYEDPKIKVFYPEPYKNEMDAEERCDELNILDDNCYYHVIHTILM